MALEIIQLVRGVLTFKLTGELNESEIDQLRLAANHAIGQWIKIRLLIILENFNGGASSRLGDGAGLVSGDGRAIEKIAIVGDNRREDLACLFVGKRAASISYFSPAERAQAVSWIVDGL